MIAEGFPAQVRAAADPDCFSNRVHWYRSDTLRFPCVTVLSDLQIHTCRPQTDTCTGSARRPRLIRAVTLLVKHQRLRFEWVVSAVRVSFLVKCAGATSSHVLDQAAVLNRLHLFGA